MNWLADHWLDVLGWGGSALLVYSLLQASVLRLRVLNAIACVILIVFNAMLEVWPMVGMNTVLVLINACFIAQLLRQRHDDTAYEVLEVSPSDEYLRHVLRVHGADILKFNPGFVHDPSSTQDAFLVQKGDETVGVVLLREDGDTAHVLLDYVTPRYRDFSPGEFVWRSSGLLAERGIRHVVTPPGMVGAYYDRLGFTRDGAAWVLHL
ncbi:GNAT family N-acetyltransferase [Nocardioides KLBMP 9356]|uniref:GNAT family N-acetyltransferase n=1 Tax=Nocardioides potassii TaxID=2911371 RepID=A0ABS9H9T8_9ACTN|nr:GNAT family N-acetyltransferase [Nocardioides potassii]MCF6377259.1 GNAT family N-acetyltransferase [Nocardioides potassii]